MIHQKIPYLGNHLFYRDSSGISDSFHIALVNWYVSFLTISDGYCVSSSDKELSTILLPSL
ncbi:hypothetical protein Anas_02070 [Armadillidium nasatum]|uniref:Uncharacterized protein n=1 Tax=Armadillidium nasatum TaxID=96803 RepID=A0A5N5SZX3_9CRUS|nr:hypothetical protein Anas_02070 [Armadillidium nasatum]